MKLEYLAACFTSFRILLLYVRLAVRKSATRSEGTEVSSRELHIFHRFIVWIIFASVTFEEIKIIIRAIVLKHRLVSSHDAWMLDRMLLTLSHDSFQSIAKYKPAPVIRLIYCRFNLLQNAKVLWMFRKSSGSSRHRCHDNRCQPNRDDSTNTRSSRLPARYD